MNLVMFKQIRQAMRDGMTKTAMELTEDLLKRGVSPKEIIDKALMPTAYELGEKYQKREIPITTVLLGSRAMLSCLHAMKDELSKINYVGKGRVVVGTVAGDLHDLGKTLVVSILKASGMEVIDLGIDVPPEDFVAAVKEYQPDFVGMSCLLTTTLCSIKTTIDLLEQSALRSKVKIIIGGTPVTEKFAKTVGADFYAPDAYSALKTLLGAEGIESE